MADMIEAVRGAGIVKPIMIIMADLPLVTSDLIDEIIEIYEERPEPALSTHTPLRLHSRLGRRPDSLFNYQGQLIVPSGINVLDGANIEKEQEDLSPDIGADRVSDKCECGRGPYALREDNAR